MTGLYKALMRERGWQWLDLDSALLRGYMKAGRSLGKLFPTG